MREGNSSLTPRDAGASALRDTWHRFTGPNANEPPRALVAAIIPGRGDVPGHLVLAQRPIEKAELLRHANLIAAAPDLLEALKEAQAFIERFEQPITSPSRSYWLRVSDVTNTAIAKATQPAASRGEATPNSTAELGA